MRRLAVSRTTAPTAAAAAGAVVLDTASLKLVPAELLGYSSGLQLIAPLLEADRVINVPVVKHHSLARATLGMKNWFGVLGSGRSRLHQDIVRAVVELGAMFRPTLTVMDATRVLLANGPQGGSLGDVKLVNAVAAGVDPVLCDAWGAAQMGLDPTSLAYLGEAERHSLGRANLTLVKELS